MRPWTKTAWRSISMAATIRGIANVQDINAITTKNKIANGKST